MCPTAIRWADPSGSSADDNGVEMNPLKQVGALLGKPVGALSGALNKPGAESTPHAIVRALRGHPSLPDAVRDKIVLITGASSGIGEAAALALGAAGGTVLLVARGEEKLRATAAEVEAVGGTAHVHPCDLTDLEAIDKLVADVVAQHGRVDILVNNAGITKDGLLMRMSEEDWDAVLDTNLKGAFSFTKVFTRAFLKQRAGRIINISSIIGLMGNAGQCNYAASKAALFGFTKSVARELGSRGITANAIAPGFIETDMTAALDEKTRAALLEKIPLNALGQAEAGMGVALGDVDCRALRGRRTRE